MPDNIYRIVVFVLLAAILGVQVYNLLPAPPPSEECVAALEDAAEVVRTSETFLLGAPGDYDTAVFDRADNINQQIFMASDQTFALLYVEAVIEHAALEVEIECRS